MLYLLPHTQLAALGFRSPSPWHLAIQYRPWYGFTLQYHPKQMPCTIERFVERSKTNANALRPSHITHSSGHVLHIVSFNYIILGMIIILIPSLVIAIVHQNEVDLLPKFLSAPSSCFVNKFLKLA